MTFEPVRCVAPLTVGAELPLVCILRAVDAGRVRGCPWSSCIDVDRRGPRAVRDLCRRAARDSAGIRRDVLSDQRELGVVTFVVVIELGARLNLRVCGSAGTRCLLLACGARRRRQRTQRCLCRETSACRSSFSRWRARRHPADACSRGIRHFTLVLNSSGQPVRLWLNWSRGGDHSTRFLSLPLCSLWHSAHSFAFTVRW